MAERDGLPKPFLGSARPAGLRYQGPIGRGSSRDDGPTGQCRDRCVDRLSTHVRITALVALSKARRRTVKPLSGHGGVQMYYWAL
jgi:hypothetical protein